jgi:cyclase
MQERSAMSLGTPPRHAEFIEVGDNIFAYIQSDGGLGVANAGVVISREYTVVVDTLAVPSMTSRLVETIARTTVCPVRYVVNTHHHFDHTGGNKFFSGAAIVSTLKCRAALEGGFPPADRLKRFIPTIAGELATQRPILPTVLFNEELVLDDGDRTIELWHPGLLAHTAGDTVVTVPSAGVLFAGDLVFLNVTPLAVQGHVSNWIATLERLLSFDAEVIVPGHGPVGSKAEVEVMRDYLAFVHREARVRYDAGMPAEEAACDIDLGRYASWREPERIVPNVVRCYQEFRNETHIPIDRTKIVEVMERLRLSYEASPLCDPTTTADAVALSDATTSGF